MELKKSVEELEIEVKQKLKKYANDNCNKCNGKGYTGINIDYNIYQTCKCVRKNKEKQSNDSNETSNKL